MAYEFNPNTWEVGDQEFKIITSYRASSELTWTTWEPVSKKKSKQKNQCFQVSTIATIPNQTINIYTTKVQFLGMEMVSSQEILIRFIN